MAKPWVLVLALCSLGLNPLPLAHYLQDLRHVMQTQLLPLETGKITGISFISCWNRWENASELCSAHKYKQMFCVCVMFVTQRVVIQHLNGFLKLSDCLYVLTYFKDRWILMIPLYKKKLISALLKPIFPSVVRRKKNTMTFYPTKYSLEEWSCIVIHT